MELFQFVYLEFYLWITLEILFLWEVIHRVSVEEHHFLIIQIFIYKQFKLEFCELFNESLYIKTRNEWHKIGMG